MRPTSTLIRASASPTDRDQVCQHVLDRVAVPAHERVAEEIDRAGGRRQRREPSPTPSSQLDAVAHPASPLDRKTTSATKAPTKLTIGNGTSIGWIG